MKITPSKTSRPALVPRAAADTFLLRGQPLAFSIGQFWQWAASDLINNTLRGVVAEFIVSQALNCGASCRDPWMPWDLKTRTGTRIEVKSASLRQSWYQAKPSAIRFSIAETFAWSAETNRCAAERKRQADIYVFCLLRNDPPCASDPLELSRWTFYLLPAAKLNEHCPKQKTISFSRLLSLKPIECPFTNLAECFETFEKPG
jgi:hypothetical protein